MKFRNGRDLPAIGLGTWPMDDTEAERVVAEAIGLGYRLIDTAFNYGNEAGVGRGVRASGIAREDVFITSKLNKSSHSIDGVRTAFESSAASLGVDYLDLFLIHWPCPAQGRYVEAWEGLVALQEAGLVRHIGVSNFLPEHLDRVIAATGVVPELDQLQINPRWTQPSARAYNAERGILTQSWSPIGQGNDLLAQPEVVDLAARHEITPAQAVLAWHLALGLAVAVKSSNTDRLASNLAAAGVSLDPADVVLLSSLDGTEQSVLDPQRFGH